MTALRKGLLLLFGMPVVLAVIFVTYFNSTGEDRMRNVCSKVKVGMSKAQVNDLMTEWRLDGKLVDSGVAVLGETRSYGRHTCKVTLANGVVSAAAYQFAD